MHLPDTTEKISEVLPKLGFPLWAWWVFILLLSFATGNTKIAGAAWFLIIALGAYYGFKNKLRVPFGSIDPIFLKAARIWLIFCVVGFFFKAVGVIYWGDPWGTRHFDFRFIFAAMAIFVFVARVEIDNSRKLQLLLALLTTSCAAVFVSYLHVNHGIETPSNRINWSGGLVMLSWCLLPVAASKGAALHQRWVAIISILLLWVAVLMTGARGAYLSFPWLLIIVVILIFYQSSGRQVILRNVAFGFIGLLSCFYLLHYLAPQAIEIPRERIVLAKEEAKQALVATEDGSRFIDTSVGTRIFMWGKSIEVFKESPWAGYGREQRMAFIKDWGEEAKAHIVSGQTHLHSEYINGMVDHGILGLASTMSYIFGLFAVFFCLLRGAPLMALSVLSIAFTHVTMSITDTNSQTNNYSVMLGLAMMLVFFFRVRR